MASVGKTYLNGNRISRMYINNTEIKELWKNGDRIFRKQTGNLRPIDVSGKLQLFMGQVIAFASIYDSESELYRNTISYLKYGEINKVEEFTSEYELTLIRSYDDMDILLFGHESYTQANGYYKYKNEDIKQGPIPVTPALTGSKGGVMECGDVLIYYSYNSESKNWENYVSPIITGQSDNKHYITSISKQLDILNSSHCITSYVRLPGIIHGTYSYYVSASNPNASNIQKSPINVEKDIGRLTTLADLTTGEGIPYPQKNILELSPNYPSEFAVTITPYSLPDNIGGSYQVDENMEITGKRFIRMRNGGDFQLFNGVNGYVEVDAHSIYMYGDDNNPIKYEKDQVIYASGKQYHYKLEYTPTVGEVYGDDIYGIALINVDNEALGDISLTYIGISAYADLFYYNNMYYLVMGKCPAYNNPFTKGLARAVYTSKNMSTQASSWTKYCDIELTANEIKTGETETTIPNEVIPSNFRSFIANDGYYLNTTNGPYYMEL